MENIKENDALEMARKLSTQKQYGKSCSFYLLYFNENVEQCRSLKTEFIYVCKTWLEKLLELSKIKEYLSFLQTVVQICEPLKCEIVIIAAELLHLNEHTYEASKILALCRTEDIKDYELEEDLEHLYNILVDRWHYRMLNDKGRNLAYSLALDSTRKDGDKRVLDIGSGTGLLSMFAVKAGFSEVVSCDISEVMCEIQSKVLPCNGFSDQIHVINKMSSEIEIGKDVSDKFDLVVTEIFDCGLLGERIIPSILHAWEKLLLPGSRVIPGSAVVRGVCVECEELRQHYKYTDTTSSLVIYGLKDPGDTNEQFYTTEDMGNIRNGFKKLSDPFVLATFDFNNPKELSKAIGKTRKISVSLTHSGKFDAVVMSFELTLTDDVTINTGVENRESCWEQAIYCVDSHTIKSGHVVQFDVTCLSEQLAISLSKDYYDYMLTKVPKPDDTCNFHQIVRTLGTDRRTVAQLNDDEYYVQPYKEAILSELHQLKSRKTELNIICICSDISIFPALLSENCCHVYLVDPSDNLLAYLFHVRPEMWNRIVIIQRPIFDDIMTLSVAFDMVISEPVDHNGMLREKVIEDLTIIRSCSTDSETVFVPSFIDVLCCPIYSQDLYIDHKLLSDERTLGLKISQFVNEYKVRTHPDLDFIMLKYERLTEDLLCEHIDFTAVVKSIEDAEEFNCTQRNLNCERKPTINNATKKVHQDNNTVTALLYWFQIHLTKNPDTSERSNSREPLRSTNTKKNKGNTSKNTSLIPASESIDKMSNIGTSNKTSKGETKTTSPLETTSNHTKLPLQMTTQSENMSTEVSRWTKPLIIDTSPSLQTHWRQSCYILPYPIKMEHGNKAILRYIRNRSNIHFTLKP